MPNNPKVEHIPWYDLVELGATSYKARPRVLLHLVLVLYTTLTHN